jgi:hypothetical protein
VPIEVITYRLEQRGVPAGTHTLLSERRGNFLQLEARMALQGPLGQLTTLQTSSTHARQFFSLSFREELKRRGENRTFDVQFDRKSGLVRARRNNNDEASVPYFRSYRDPLGMLQQIRQLQGSPEREVIPLLGHDVTVNLVAERELETALGKRTCFVYQLLPGGSLLWVDTSPPWPILQMQQRIDGAPLDVKVTKLAVREAAAPEARGQARTDERPERSGRARRPQRRRRRKRR